MQIVQVSWRWEREKGRGRERERGMNWGWGGGVAGGESMCSHVMKGPATHMRVLDFILRASGSHCRISSATTCDQRAGSGWPGCSPISCLEPRTWAPALVPWAPVSFFCLISPVSEVRRAYILRECWGGRGTRLHPFPKCMEARSCTWIHVSSVSQPPPSAFVCPETLGHGAGPPPLSLRLTWCCLTGLSLSFTSAFFILPVPDGR